MKYHEVGGCTTHLRAGKRHTASPPRAARDTGHWTQDTGYRGFEEQGTIPEAQVRTAVGPAPGVAAD